MPRGCPRKDRVWVATKTLDGLDVEISGFKTLTEVSEKYMICYKTVQNMVKKQWWVKNGRMYRIYQKEMPKILRNIKENVIENLEEINRNDIEGIYGIKNILPFFKAILKNKKIWIDNCIRHPDDPPEPIITE